MKAIVVDAFGPAEHLRLQDLPGPTGEIIVNAAYAGINFVDLYQREGKYPGVTLPLRPGLEGSGVVVEAPGGSEWKVGARVAYTTGVQGSYAERVAVPAAHLVPVPDGIGLREASAALEHGLTARVLIDAVARMAPASSVLVHAAAGGVGGWLVQLLRAAGHRVLGTASSDAKLQWLQGIGIEPFMYGDHGDWASEVMRATHGKGVDVVFDSVGAATFDGSLEVLAVTGHLVLFGAASGQPVPVDVLRLMRKSLTLSRPVLPHYLPDTASLRRHAARVFEDLASGTVVLRIDGIYTLEDVARAQRTLASRTTQGKLLIAIDPALDDRATSATSPTKREEILA